MIENITFMPFSKKDLSLWEQWVTIPHVKDVWFIEGYETADYIHEKIQGNGYDYAFIIYIDQHPIGYIQCSDLYAYKTKCPLPEGVFTNEAPGTYCLDLFIADVNYLNKGYGTSIVTLFTKKLLSEFHAKKILIDPAATNKRAIRCYEKAGYEFVGLAHDGVTECYVMQMLNDKV